MSKELVNLNLSALLDSCWAVLGFGVETQALVRQVKRRDPSAVVHIFSEHEVQLDADFPLSDQDHLHIGPLDAAQLGQFNILVKSPGISPLHPALMSLDQSIRITSTTNLWFAERPAERVIAVTGTKGKSTTASLLAHIMRSSGVSVQLVGNIGEPLIAHIGTQADWWVLELSSYQTADLRAQPEIGVVLSLFPEHLDWHGGENIYMRDKLRLLSLSHQAWAPLSLQSVISELYPKILPQVQWLQGEQQLRPNKLGVMQGQQLILAAKKLALKGLHNLYNLCIAWELARHVGLDDEQIAAAAITFEALPHRLQLLPLQGPWFFVNDSISTTPHATIAALEAFERQIVCLLVGGHDRGLDWQVFVDYLKRHPVHTLITMGEHGRKIKAQVKAQCDTAQISQLLWAPDLPQAMRLACAHTPENAYIILSPGAPSYGEFKSFAQRGERFWQLAEQACSVSFKSA